MPNMIHAPIARTARVRQRGVTLIEALVALLVMSFGMLALVGLMSNLRLGIDVARQRSEAMRIARAEIAKLRAFSVLTTAEVTDPKQVAYETLLPSTDDKPSSPKTPDDSNTTYNVQYATSDLTTSALSAGQGKLVRVRVNWKDRAGEEQFINLDTIIAKVDPVFSAVVGFVPPSSPIARPSGRNPVIPDVARKLNKDISAFQPSATSPTVWIFNNVTGVITSVCTLGTGATIDTLTASGASGCSLTASYLVSGTVRFSNANPARPGGSAGEPEATALPVNFTFAGGDFSVPTVKLNSAGIPVTGTIALDALNNKAVVAPTNANSLANNTFYCFNDYANSTQSFVNYYCAVTPNAASTATPFSASAPGPRVWSGQLQLTGLSLGTTATQYRVCRYSADYNGNGGNLLADGATLDNQEHPLVYSNVTGPIVRQNFLVIRGDVSCPSASAVAPASGIFADYSTVQLQP